MELIAQGRACDVFALDAQRVLRRERTGRSLEREAVVMRHLVAHGFPCPQVHDAAGADLVLDRIDGPTLGDAVVGDGTHAPDPHHVLQAAELLAGLHERLHTLPPLPGHHGSIRHLDLHPFNVLLGPDGPMVIDWTNADHGDPALDPAMTWVLVHPYTSLLPATADFITAFVDRLGREAIVAALPEAVRRRLADPHTLAEERVAVEELLRVHGG